MTAADPAPPPRRSRVGWALCGALALGGALTPALAAALSPRMAAGLAVCDGFTLTTFSPQAPGQLAGWTSGHDAWGRPVRLQEVMEPTPAGMALRYRLEVRSLGPDPLRADDDLVLTEDDLALAGALHASPIAGVLLAAALAWCLAGPFTHAPRAPSSWREVARAVGLAGLPALLVLGAGRLATLGPDVIFGDPLDRLLDSRAMPTLLVSPGVAFALAYAGVAFALAYAWRATRPRAQGLRLSAPSARP